MPTIDSEGKTSCCNAYTKIGQDDGIEFCRNCHADIDGAGSERFTVTIKPPTGSNTAMKIELRNVKHFAAGSEETECFTASIYVDGKPAGTAKNDGHGGCTWIEPRELEARLSEYAKTLPPVVSDSLMDGDKPFTYQQDAEGIVNDLLDDYLQTRDMNRTMKNAILFVGPDGKLRKTGKAKQPGQLAHWLGAGLDDTLKSFGVGRDAILNLMPPEQALAAYRKHGR